ncbi:hypothetical protein H8E88_33955 [candidate division KSB1 bacterium]|nr:hypothetical protein [candidate division KSB1 bacterium]
MTCNTIEQAVRFGPASTCVSNEHGIVAHTTGENYLIEFFSANGKKFKQISMPGFHPLKVTEQDRHDVFLNLSFLPESFTKNFVFAETKRIFKALRFDEVGNLWAIRESIDKKLFADVFDDAGNYIAEVYLPQMLYFIGDDYAYGIKTTGFDSYVIRYKIIKNKQQAK